MKLKTCNGIPIVRQCDSCDTWLDKESKELVEDVRSNVEYLISHGKCKPCFDTLMAKMDAEEAEEDRIAALDCPATERSPVPPAADTLESVHESGIRET